MEMIPDALRDALALAAMAQLVWVERWHDPDAPEEADLGGARGVTADLLALVLRQHRQNFLLWHVEDRARRSDVDDAVIAQCKRDIDALNQRRNDLMEQVDAMLVRIVATFPVQRAKKARARLNTETLGAALDRLSILSLKMFHMREQAQRVDAGAEHVAKCSEKLQILKEQHEDLTRSVEELVADYAKGAKRPKMYYQCKMYNDPALNPELYSGAASRSHD